MNHHELNAALGNIRSRMDALIEALPGREQPGDAQRRDDLGIIAVEIEVMQRELAEGQWAERSLEGYALGSDGALIDDESSVVR